MSFSNIHFVLHKPQLSENIGSCARALKNFKFKNLCVVSPRVSFPNDKIIATSVGAKNIIKNTKVYQNFDNAVKNYNCVIATTTRIRNKNFNYLNIKDLKKKVDFTKKVAFIFGPESSGLSNNELSYANYVIKLPTNPNFGSINISHSLIIFCYELFNIFNNKEKKILIKKVKIAKKKDFIKFFQFLINSLDNIGFLKPIEKKKSMIGNIKTIFLNMNLSEKDIRILSSIIGSLIKKKG